MSIYFSKSTHGFYDDAINDDKMPADVVAISDELHAELLQNQSAGQCIECGDDGIPFTMAPPPPSRELIVESLRIAVDNRREGMISAGLTFNGHPYQTGRDSIMNIIGVLAAITAGLPLPENFAWRDTDNVDVPMDADTFKLFAAAVMDHVNAIYTESWAVKDKIDAAPSPESIDMDAEWAKAAGTP